MDQTECSYDSRLNCALNIPSHQQHFRSAVTFLSTYALAPNRGLITPTRLPSLAWLASTSTDSTYRILHKRIATHVVTRRTGCLGYSLAGRTMPSSCSSGEPYRSVSLAKKDSSTGLVAEASPHRLNPVVDRRVVQRALKRDAAGEHLPGTQ